MKKSSLLFMTGLLLVSSASFANLDNLNAIQKQFGGAGNITANTPTAPAAPIFRAPGSSGGAAVLVNNNAQQNTNINPARSSRPEFNCVSVMQPLPNGRGWGYNGKSFANISAEWDDVVRNWDKANRNMKEGDNIRFWNRNYNLFKITNDPMYQDKVACLVEI